MQLLALMAVTAHKQIVQRNMDIIRANIEAFQVTLCSQGAQAIKGLLYLVLKNVFCVLRFLLRAHTGAGRRVP